ncbi:cytochrome P450 78A5-like [Prosopis cineraria]|uniref:cytochrome P450 78A5-like n=1 Tax=Prosopis cineraria TaxID=364024 RepID=UPI00240EC019|nr:cytochrome P450 78A5-like [Prosopis cineraria]
MTVSSSPSSLSFVNSFFLVLCLGAAILFHFETTILLRSYWPLTLFLFSSLTLLAFSLNYLLVPGGFAWRNYDHCKSPNNKFRGPTGWPILGILPQMGSRAHRNLAAMASSLNAKRLMSFSLGTTPVIISSHPETAREILYSVSFSDRPTKQSARLLMFERAIGFASAGTYWRHLRKIAGSMFSPRGISGIEILRQHVADEMAMRVEKEMEDKKVVEVRGILQKGSLSNILETVFGSSLGDHEKKELGTMVEEGYDLIAEFNWEDFFPLKFLDVKGLKRRCQKLAAKVSGLIGQIVKHRKADQNQNHDQNNDLLSTLLCLPVEERLDDADMVAVLWEMIFRGTDTVAILLEWIMTRMVLHQDIQLKARQEIDTCVGENGHVRESDIPNLPYLQAIVKESLRLHPPGPLLSWARLAVNDVHVDKMFVPAGTTAMVNMWAITHDSEIWEDPWAFKPERFIKEDVSIMGSDLRLAPFGAGRRVCPGRALALATVHLWLARLLHNFIWVPTSSQPVELSECLRLSLEKTNPLRCQVIRRR